MRHRFLTADVFTDRPFGGNPLAVFPDARVVSAERMQQVARELNLSETVFVLPPDDPAYTRRLRIFTPGAELPFAGHPTVGTAIALAAIGEVSPTGDLTRIVFEEGVGPVPVSIRSVGGRPVFAQLTAAKLPEIGPEPPPRAALADLLSLAPEDLEAGDLPVRAVSCGGPFTIVPLRDPGAVSRASIRLERWRELLAGSWAPEVFVVARGGELPGSDLHGRMFAPSLGIGEDPATGAAAAALGGYLGLLDSTADGTLRWVLEQGLEMGRPSRLEIEADKRGGRVVAVRVGGAAVMMSEGWMEIPE